MSLLIGAAVGYLSMVIPPCRLFGSSNEGACEYGQFWFSISAALLVAAISFLGFAFLSLRIASHRFTSPERQQPLIWTWFASFASLFVLPLAFHTLQLGSLIDLPVMLFVLLLFIATSMIVAHRSGRRPSLALLALIPYIGVILVAVLLFKNTLELRGSDA